MKHRLTPKMGPGLPIPCVCVCMCLGYGGIGLENQDVPIAILSENSFIMLKPGLLRKEAQMPSLKGE